MRLSTLFLLAMGAAALVTGGWIFWRTTAETREWNELISWSGRTLNPAESARIQALVRKDVPSAVDRGFSPWRVLRRVGPGASERVLIFYEQQTRAIPGTCPLQVFVLNENRKHLSSTTLEAGWRVFAEDVEAPVKADLGPWGFMVQTDGDQQYYVLIHDRPVLVRLEEPEKSIKRNNYEAPNWTIGPPLPIRSPEEWEQSLWSGDRWEILGALIWLGGIHAPPTPPDPTFHRESFEEAKRFSDTCRRPGIKRRVALLAESSDRWISQAAQVVLAELPK